MLFDVQRVGPSTGMPTRTQQADLLSAAYASHGDTKHVLLFPRDPRECFELTLAAFDLADRLQTPVIVMSDLDIGMNDWLCPELDWDPAYRPDRGKVLSAVELEAAKTFHRYVDVDGDGIPQRTLPGVHPRGAYFVRGSGHNQYGGYTEDAGEYCQVVDRLARKWQTAAELVPEPAIRRSRKGAALGIVAVGSCDAAIEEALDRLAAKGVYADYCRIRAFPFSNKVRQFLEQHEHVFVVEQNRDAQLKTLLLAEMQHSPARLQSVLNYGGLPMDHRCVTDALTQHAASGVSPHDPDAQTANRAPRPQAQRIGAHGARLRRRHVDVVRRVRSRFDNGRDRAGVLLARHCAAQCREDERHRLLVENAGVLSERVARVQLRAWPHAVDCDRRERREPRAIPPRSIRRR